MMFIVILPIYIYTPGILELKLEPLGFTLQTGAFEYQTRTLGGPEVNPGK